MAALPSVSRWSKDARAAAYKWGIPVKDLLGLVQIETGGNEGETSPTGAQGLTQFEPGTARGYHVNVAPGHAASQLEGAAHYLHDLGFAKNPTLALASYNAGPANPGAGMGYAGDVLSAAKNYSSLGGPRSGSARMGHAPSPHATTARAGTTTTRQTSEQAQPDITGLLSALGQQSQPSFVRANFDPGQNKYLRQGNTAPTPGSTSQPTGQGDLSSQIAALSQLVGPSQTTTTTTMPAPSSLTDVVKGNNPTTGTLPAGKVKGFKTGDPVVGGTGIGGLHQTDGLAGYPAHDFFAPSGSRAVAPISGTVFKLSGHDPKMGPVQGPHGPLGWSVYIRGTDGKNYFLTHLGTRTVRVGEKLSAGQQIGTVADYAKYGTPSHIHMGVQG